MHRRTFLQTATALSASVATAPILLGMTDKSGSRTPTVGEGAHVYECHHRWGELPDGFAWQTTHNVAVDAEGLVYISHLGMGKKEDCVAVFDRAGKFVRSFGKEWHGGGHGLDIRREGNEEFIYLANTRQSPQVAKTTLKGEIVWTKNRPETEEYADPQKVFRPTNIAFRPDGGFYVGDGYGSDYIHIYDVSGKLEKTFGGTGTEPGKFKTPHGQWVDTRNPANPELVVCDRANARLQYMKLDGTFLRETPAGTVLFPANIDTRGEIMLVPDLHARVSLFGPDNQPIVHLGDDAEWRKQVLDGFKVRVQPKQWQAGKFVHPHDACFDADGNIFVVEWVVPGRVTFLKKVA